MNSDKKYYSLIVFFLIVLTILPVINFKNMFPQKSFSKISSVWCFMGSKETKICKLKNVCYEPSLKTFLFFLTNDTIIKGLLHYSELQNIQLSSINHHNQFYANLSVVVNFDFKKNIVIEPKGFLFSRFKPNNIMHVIHDDLFPAYFTLEQVCASEILCIESFRLVFHDNFPTGPFYDLYKLFSYKSPMLLNHLDKGTTLCFDELLVGLVTDCVFYQYGFGKPQSSLKTPYLFQNDVLRFSNFIKRKIDREFEVDIVVVSRLKNRKILNVDEVTKSAKKLHKDIYNKNSSKVLVLDLSNYNILDFIQVVSQIDVLIGMHGAEMIFSLFMKPNSTVIEFFPYGIAPEIVSFVKPLAELEGSSLNYISWRNLFKNNSIPHPNAHPLYGGINHLDEKEQETIKNTKQVPPVECCNNPTYLYHMYQDTWVSNNFEELVYKYFKGKKNFEDDFMKKKWFFPNIPSNASCMFKQEEKSLFVIWFPPFNVEEVNKVKYSLYLKGATSNYWKEITTVETSLEIEVEKESRFQVWISVFYKGLKSSDLYFECFK